MMWIVLLTGCGPSWTESGAVAPTRARLDTDGDGRVDEAEYSVVTMRGSPFASIDLNDNGDLSDEELLAVVLETDPLVFSSGRPDAKVKAAKKRQQERKAPPKKIENQPADARRVRTESQWVVRNILLSLKAEIRAKDANHVVPTDDVIKLAAMTGDIRTAEARAVLAELERESDAVSIDFPASLRASALAKVAVTPTPLPEEMPPPEAAGLGPARRSPGGPRGPGMPKDPRRPDGTPSGTPAPGAHTGASP